MNNAGRNTNIHTPLHPTTTHHEELADESADAERRFIEHIIAMGIPLADLEDKE